MSTDKEWAAFGERDPYFGVLSADRFRSASTQGQARNEFFASGEEHVARMFQIVRDGLEAGFAPRRALDFGCGVGRLVLPLARRVDRVVGVDISTSMLEEARKNCEKAEIENATFVQSDDRLTGLEGTFDFVHSFIVFQHIEPSKGEVLMAKIVSCLAEGGVGALHVTYGSRASRPRRLARRLRSAVPILHQMMNLAQGRPWSAPRMEMNAYRIDHILLMLQESGCHDVRLRFTEHSGELGVMLLFKKTVLPVL